MKKVIVFETIDHGKHRMDTIGDWIFDRDGNIIIRCSKLKRRQYELLVFVHEFIEALLCQEDGVSQAEVDRFDLLYSGNGEPGAEKDAPYRKEHKIAEQVERILARHLGINWKKYNQNLDYVFDKGR